MLMILGCASTHQNPECLVVSPYRTTQPDLDGVGRARRAHYAVAATVSETTFHKTPLPAKVSETTFHKPV
jgi:hypothetical protein